MTTWTWNGLTFRDERGANGRVTLSCAETGRSGWYSKDAKTGEFYASAENDTARIKGWYGPKDEQLARDDILLIIAEPRERTTPMHDVIMQACFGGVV